MSMPPFDPKACICDRKATTVLCTVCYHCLLGRLQLSCPQHVNTFYTMDLNGCPKCLAEVCLMREMDLEPWIQNTIMLAEK